MTYKLYFASRADLTKTASSKREALAIARRVLGVDRVYQGARYATDEPDGDGERRSVEAFDLWVNRAAANKQTDACADCVVTW